MSNSPLVSYTRLSPNHSGKRTHTVDRITPHCVVGQCSVEALGEIFAPVSKQASCQYGIGADGRVGMYVEEKNRSWCSSSGENDQRAITIECASDITHPYAFKDVVYNKLIDLCVDICQRYGKTKLLWFEDKSKTLNYNPAADEMVLTVHRWFANKSCPGDWMYARMGDLATKVTMKLGGQINISKIQNNSATIASNEEENEVTQENFNKMMNAYLINLAQKDTTWAQDYLDWARDAGIMVGDDKGRMMPQKFCTRQEVVVMIKRLYDLMNREKK